MALLKIFKKKPEKKEKTEKKPVKAKSEVKQKKVKEEKKDATKKSSSVSAAEKKPAEKRVKAASKQSELASRLLIKPVITEKTTMLQARGCYAFAVARQANKISIKQAVRDLYGVTPVRVNIIRLPGKQTRYGRTVGKTKSWKKALVYLKPGDKIEFAKP